MVDSSILVSSTYRRMYLAMYLIIIICNEPIETIFYVPVMH